MLKNKPFDKTRCKLAAFDLDGTILNHGKLSPKNLNALWALHHSGVEMVISTGRHHRMIPREVRNLPFFRYAITANGSYILDLKQNKDIFYSAFDFEFSLELVKLFAVKAEVSHIFTRDKVIVSVKDFLSMQRFFPKNKSKKEDVDFFDWARLEISPYLNIKFFHIPFGKISAYFSDAEDCQKLLSQIKTSPNLEALSTNGRDIEITKHGVDKGMGLVKLCKLLGVKEDETITFGDSANDIAILQRSGYAVVMGHADEDVKQHADFISLSVEDDGVAHAIHLLFA
ncbi:MAG: HAD family hydrolase [Anaerolineae bacterium]|nr:HAD family hydrolase [Anaerolineae bacterium]